MMMLLRSHQCWFCVIETQRAVVQCTCEAQIGAANIFVSWLAEVE